MQGALRKKKVALDLLRCIAMLMVLLVHLNQRINMNPLFSYGAYGVQVFFVMSGYLGIASFERSGSIGEFYKRRINKIVFAYEGVLLVTILVHEFILGDVPIDSLHLGWLRYFLFLNRVIPTTEYFWYNLHGYWTMGAFVFFYLLVPLIAKWCNTFQKTVVGFLGAIIMQLVNNVVYKIVFSGRMTNIDEFSGGTCFHELYMFMIGVMVYYAVREGVKAQRILYFVLLLFAILGMVGNRTHYFFAVLTAVYIMNMQRIEDRNILKNCKWLKTLIHTTSRYSFAIYLVHLLCFQLSEYACIQWFGSEYNLICWLTLAFVLILFFSYIVVNIFGRIQLK